MNEAEIEPCLDTEMTILANLTLVYRALPPEKTAHPLRFSEECIAAAREALQWHQNLTLRYLNKRDIAIRVYVDWYAEQLFHPKIISNT